MVRRGEWRGNLVGSALLVPADPATQTSGVPDTTRVLILGQSNTGGVQLAEPSVAWPNLLARALPDLAGTAVSIVVRPFFAHVPGAREYLERELARHAPDIVILMVTTFSFASPVIEPAVRRRFGMRIGDAYHWLADSFDRGTRNRGRLPRQLNTAVRAVATRILPAAPVSAYETALEGTLDALRLLARSEDTQVMAFHGFVKFAPARRGPQSGRERQVRRFLSEVKEAADSLHIAFINMQDSPEVDPQSWFMPDGLHVTARAHEAIAATVLAAFRDGRLSLPAGGGKSGAVTPS